MTNSSGNESQQEGRDISEQDCLLANRNLDDILSSPRKAKNSLHDSFGKALRYRPRHLSNSLHDGFDFLKTTIPRNSASSNKHFESFASDEDEDFSDTEGLTSFHNDEDDIYIVEVSNMSQKVVNADGLVITASSSRNLTLEATEEKEEEEEEEGLEEDNEDWEETEAEEETDEEDILIQQQLETDGVGYKLNFNNVTRKETSRRCITQQASDRFRMQRRSSSRSKIADAESAPTPETSDVVNDRLNKENSRLQDLDDPAAAKRVQHSCNSSNVADRKNSLNKTSDHRKGKKKGSKTHSSSEERAKAKSKNKERRHNNDDCALPRSPSHRKRGVEKNLSRRGKLGRSSTDPVRRRSFNKSSSRKNILEPQRSASMKATKERKGIPRTIIQKESSSRRHSLAAHHAGTRSWKRTIINNDAVDRNPPRHESRQKSTDKNDNLDGEKLERRHSSRRRRRPLETGSESLNNIHRSRKHESEAGGKVKRRSRSRPHRHKSDSAKDIRKQERVPSQDLNRSTGGRLERMHH